MKQDGKYQDTDFSFISSSVTQIRWLENAKVELEILQIFIFPKKLAILPKENLPQYKCIIIYNSKMPVFRLFN